MSLRPILSTLARHRIAAGLIVLEVALALSFVSNALHMIAVRVERLNHRSGLVENELVNLDLRGIAPIQDADALTAEDMRRLRALPGVKGVAASNQILYGDNNVNSGVSNRPDNSGKRVAAASYQSDEHFVPVHGLKLLAGRNFTADEIISGTAFNRDPAPKLPVIIVSKDLADAMYPGESAVGKPVWVVAGPTTIIGVVEALPSTQPSRQPTRYGFVAPIRQNFRGTYVLRVEPGQEQQVLKQAVATIRDVDARRSVQRAKTLTEMRNAYYAEDRAMSWLLLSVCAALLAVTAFGIVGLASFWVAQRTRMIGIRRALGATQKQILHYFQLENLLLCSAGTLLGAVGAWALSQFFMQPQGAPSLPWQYMPIGALLLLVLGQVAVLAPAYKAANVPAALAMRV